jgi:peptidyl-tRNA hydrolase, PTH1 family
MKLFRRASNNGDATRRIVVGLGNPGGRYSSTRHNAGAMVVDYLVDEASAALKRHKSGCLIAEVTISENRTVLARPISYMNESGAPVAALARWYKVSVEELIVVHDEIDLPFGDVRVKAGGGTAGHNGLRSLVSHLGSNDFLRVRLGVSRPPGRRGAKHHVLDDFDSGERLVLPELIERGAYAVERILAAGVERAMNEINTRT